MIDGPVPDDPTPYPVGLLLAGRRVVIVGGGAVAARRIPALLARGARVSVIDPSPGEQVRAWAQAERLELVPRGYRSGDLTGAWYVLAVASDRGINQTVAQDAEESRLFCVRADEAGGGTAVTPASGAVPGGVVAVFTSRWESGSGLVARPVEARRLRDRAVEALTGEPNLELSVECEPDGGVGR